MNLKRLRARLLAVAGLLAPASTAAAADGALPVVAVPAFAPVVPGCPGGCEPVAVGPVLGGCTGLGAAGTGIGLFAPNRRNRRGIDGQNQPACAYNNYPLSDWLYIRRFCRPTIIPGTCYGHFQTKWRKWEDHCPQQAGGCAPAGVPVFDAPPPAAYMPSQPLPPASQPLAAPQPAPAPKGPEPKAADEPKKPMTMESSRLVDPLPSVPELPPAGAPDPLPVRTILK